MLTARPPGPIILVGIEVLDAKQILGQGKVPSVELENVPVIPAQ